MDVDAAAMALATFQGFELMPHGGFMRYRDGGFTESAFSRFTDQVRIVLQSASRPTEWRAIESAPRDGTRFLGATYCTTSLPGHESAELAPPWRMDRRQRRELVLRNIFRGTTHPLATPPRAARN